jgi:RNA polymerase sigma-70 factor (ECF subfamily)
VTHAARFLARLGEPQLDAASTSALVEALDRLIASARVELPRVEVPVDRFVDRLADVIVRRSDGGDALHVLARIRAGELALACACEAGQKDALSIFERDYVSSALRSLVARGLVHGIASDAVQELRVRLLASDGSSPPRIAGYDGLGSLEGWLRVAALRTALNLRRSERPASRAAASVIDRIADLAVSPELQVMRQRHEATLRAAVEGAFEALDDEDRTLLRMHIVDGMSLTQLAKMMGLHKSSLSRRVADVRERMNENVRDTLFAQGIGRSEAESLIRILQSGLHVSVARLLAEEP